MADNTVSYERFTLLPTNLAERLPSAEELKLSSGKPDRNPAASPMASPAESLQRLAMVRGSAEPLRVGNLPQLASNPYLGPTGSFLLLYRINNKLAAPMVEQLQALLMQQEDAKHLKQQRESIRRLRSMQQLLGELYSMLSQIRVRAIKGARS